MEIVQQKLFINATQQEINSWLSYIPAEKIISASYHTHGTSSAVDEFTSIFYKSKRQEK